jgi:mono/diheme cytochrome c family protein
MSSRLAISSALCAISIGLVACQAFSLVTGEDEGARMRGRQTAEERCAACHAVGKSATSPRAGAPTFADLRRRYTSPALLRELEASDAVGHYGMPVVPTSAAEREDLAAYVESLERRPAR